MSNLVIIIGGSSSRVAQAGVHAIAANMMAGNEALQFMIVDKDLKNGTTDSLDTLTGIYTAFTGALGSNRQIARHDISKNDWTLNAILKGREKASLQDYYPNSEALLDTVFSRMEKTKPLGDGFERHPNIGAVFFEQIKKDPTFTRAIDEALQDARNNQPSHIFIIGSIFGGTGASMFSNIAEFIHQKAKAKVEEETARRGDTRPASMDVRKNVTIGGVLLLPYFRIPAPRPEQKITGELITDKDFIQASQKSLQYYNRIQHLIRNRYNAENAIFDALYVAGYSPNVNLRRKPDEVEYAKGGEKQISDCSVVDLFAATAMTHFFNTAASKGGFDISKSGGSQQNLFVAQLAQTGDSDPDLEFITWNALPPGTQDHLLQMARFSLFITTDFFAEYKSTKRKKDTLYLSLLKKEVAEGADVIDALKAVNSYCRSFLEFLLSVASSKSSEAALCSLLDIGTFEKLLEQLDTLAPDGCDIKTAEKAVNEIDSRCLPELGADQEGMTVAKKLGRPPERVIAYTPKVLRDALKAKFHDKKTKAGSPAELFEYLYGLCAINTQGGDVQ